MTTKKKHFLGILMAIFALVGVFALAGCNQQAPADDSAATTEATDAEGASADKSAEVKVCFVEIVENGAFTTMMDGFKQGMEEAGYTNVTYDVENAQGDSATLNQIAASLKDSDYDVIVPIATPASQACANAGITTPMVFMSVTDPVAAGITSSLDKPDKGMTGTSNVSDVEGIFKFGQALVPDDFSKGVGILYCTGETNAVVTAEHAKEYLEGEGITVTERTVTNSSEVQQTGTQLASEVGVIYVPVDSVVQSGMTQLTEAALKVNVPVLGTDPVMTEDGALESVSVSNTNLGIESAKLAIEAMSGTPIADIPILVMSSDDYAVNKATAEALGVTIPEEFEGHTVRVID